MKDLKRIRAYMDEEAWSLLMQTVGASGDSPSHIIEALIKDNLPFNYSLGDWEDDE